MGMLKIPFLNIRWFLVTRGIIFSLRLFSFCKIFFWHILGWERWFYNRELNKCLEFILFVFKANVTRICFPLLPNEWLLFPPYSLLYVVLLLPKLLPTFLSMVGDKLNCFQAKTPQCIFLWPLQVGLGRHSICTCWRSWILSAFSLYRM